MMAATLCPVGVRCYRRDPCSAYCDAEPEVGEALAAGPAPTAARPACAGSPGARRSGRAAASRARSASPRWCPAGRPATAKRSWPAIDGEVGEGVPLSEQKRQLHLGLTQSASRRCRRPARPPAWPSRCATDRPPRWRRSCSGPDSARRCRPVEVGDLVRELQRRAGRHRLEVGCLTCSSSVRWASARCSRAAASAASATPCAGPACPTACPRWRSSPTAWKTFPG